MQSSARAVQRAATRRSIKFPSTITPTIAAAPLSAKSSRTIFTRCKPAFEQTFIAKGSQNGVQSLQHRRWKSSVAEEQTQTQEGESKLYDFEDIRTLSSEPSTTSKTLLIDAREPGELESTGRIPGAQNIPVASQPHIFFASPDEFEDQLGFAMPDKDTELVFYCKAGVRSRAAAQLARQAGWTKTGEYPGSWLDWFEKGGKVER